MVSVSFTSYIDISQNALNSTLLVAIVFILVQLVFHNMWCYFGHQLKIKFHGTKFEVWMMRFLSLLMLGSLTLLFF